MWFWRLGIGACGRIEGEVKGAVRVEASQTIAGGAIDGSEVAADEDLSAVEGVSRINSDGIDGAVDGKSWIEGLVETAVVIEASEAGMLNAAEGDKAAADQEFLVRLQSDDEFARRICRIAPLNLRGVRCID